MRETDLYDFQRQLDRLDETRKNGQWVDDEGRPAEYYVQWVCLPFGFLFLIYFSFLPFSVATLVRSKYANGEVDASVSLKAKLCTHIHASRHVRAGIRSPGSDAK